MFTVVTNDNETYLERHHLGIAQENTNLTIFLQISLS